MRTFTGVPVLCGHRGSGQGVVRGERENTLGSFRAAVAAGLPWAEGRRAGGAPEVARLERPIERSLEIAHAAGLQVAAWCPPPDAAAALADAGVDCLVVDGATSWRRPGSSSATPVRRT